MNPHRLTKSNDRGLDDRSKLIFGLAIDRSPVFLPVLAQYTCIHDMYSSSQNYQTGKAKKLHHLKGNHL